MEFLQQLRVNNNKRQKMWDPENKLDLSFKALEFAGEAGELASKIKKIVRQDLGIVGGRIDVAEIEEEVADVLITLDLLCSKLNINIQEVTKAKFDSVSKHNGFNVFFEARDKAVKSSKSVTNPFKPFTVLVEGKQYTLYRRKYLPLSNQQILDKLSVCYGLKLHPTYLINPRDIDEIEISINDSSQPDVSTDVEGNIYKVKFNTKFNTELQTYVFIARNTDVIKHHLNQITEVDDFTWDKVNRQYLCAN